MNAACDRAQLVITTAWVGSLWTIGYLVAPTLFITLSDAVLAGTIAGRLFYAEAWVSVVCALLLTICSFYQHKRASKLVLGMLICTLIGYFTLHPFMANLRELGLTNQDVKWKFGVLHSISSGIYLLQSVLGAMLVLEQRNRVNQRQ